VASTDPRSPVAGDAPHLTAVPSWEAGCRAQGLRHRCQVFRAYPSPVLRRQQSEYRGSKSIVDSLRFLPIEASA
jgi:hypothetical protein